MAWAAASSVGAETRTVPSSFMVILTPVLSMIVLMVFPLGPIKSLVFSGSMWVVTILGANGEISSLGLLITESILSRM